MRTINVYSELGANRGGMAMKTIFHLLNQYVTFILLLVFSAPTMPMAVLEEVVVTARKRAESYEDVPVAINVFTEDEIESAGIETPHDFIALTPNASIVQTQNAGNSFIVVRGISQARNSEPSVAVLYDGVLMANPAQFNQELFDIEQIEFLKGPQGALYGKNAIGGAITINTKQPSDEFEGKIKVGGDNGPGYKVQAGVSGPVPGMNDLKYRASFSYKDTDGYIGNPFLGEEADPYKDVSGRLKLLWTPTDNFTADFRFTRSELDTQALYFNIVANANDTSLPVRVNNAGENERDLMNVSLKLDFDTDYGTFTSVTSYDEVEELLTGDSFDFLPIDESFNVNFLSVNILGLPRGSIPDFNQSQFLDVEAISQEIRFTSPGDRRFRYIAGAYLIATDRFIATGNMVDTGGGVFPVFRQPRGNFPFDFATDPVNPQATFLSDSQDNFAWAIFGEIAYDISDDLEATFSLRYDRDKRENTTETPNAFFAGTLVGASFNGQVRERTWDDLQPKFSLRWKPLDNLTLYTTLSRGFRSGGFNQAGVAAAGVLGVEDTFSQETANTIEIGAKAQFFDGRLNTGIAAFHTNAEGSYYFVFLADSSTQNLGSLDELEYRGLELEATARLSDGFTVNAALGITDSEIEADAAIPTSVGNQAPLVSRYTFNAGGQYRYPIEAFGGLEAFIRADYQITGKTYWDPQNSTTRRPVDLLDIRFGIGAEDNWSLTFWSKNLLDEKYNTEFSPGGFVFKAAPNRWGIDFVKEF